METIPDSARFLANVLEATVQGLIPWETTADPATLIGQLEGDYSLKIREVADFDENSPEPSPDYILSLHKARRTIMEIDRRDFSPEDLGTLQQRFRVPHFVFVEIWRRGYFKANKISESVDEANKILDKLISNSTPF